MKLQRTASTVVMIASAAILWSCEGEPCDRSKERFRQAEFEGEVVEKYNDKTNHGAHSIRMASGKVWVFLGKTYDIFDSLEIADFVIKNKGEDSVYVKRDSMELYYWVDCN